MKTWNEILESPRVRSYELGADGGRFYIDGVLCVIASDGAGWDHVSVSVVDGSLPTWKQMQDVKRLFFLDAETAMQLHPPEDVYVDGSHLPKKVEVLHIWRPQVGEIPLPPLETV